MAKKNLKGKFITFEGSEGSGKSTQSRLLYRYLKNRGYNVLYLREPGSTNIGERIRKILLEPKNKSMDTTAEMLLYMAARAQMVNEVVLPALRKDKIVICDRFLDSTIAYQGYGLKIDIKPIKYIGRFVTRGIKPDLTLFLDIPTKKGLRVIGRAKDRIERRSLSYHRGVRKGYLGIARQEPGRFRLIKVEKDKNKTQAKIRKIVLNRIKDE